MLRVQEEWAVCPSGRTRGSSPIIPVHRAGQREGSAFTYQKSSRGQPGSEHHHVPLIPWLARVPPLLTMVVGGSVSIGKTTMGS